MHPRMSGWGVFLKGLRNFCHYIMEHEGNNMNRKDDLGLIRKYLLGCLEDEAEVRRLEEKILLEEDFCEKLSLVEDELMEGYLDGELNDFERTQFYKVFLAAPQRRADLSLLQNLRRYASKVTGAASDMPSRSNAWLSGLHKMFSFLTPARAAFAAILLVGLAVGFWWFTAHQSDTEKGLAQLRAAYAGKRPFRSRVTAFPEHIDFIETRGPVADAPDGRALDRAHRYLVDASMADAGANTRHALGLYYLAGRDFERAKNELQLAESADPNDAYVQNDLGAIFLEIAGESVSGEEKGRVFELLNEGLKHIDRARALNPDLIETRFNRALCLQALMDFEQAKTAWREYLQVDSHSGWAAEARRYLEKLEQTGPQNRSAEDLESEFLDAVRSGDFQAAKTVLHANRELIKERYLPQRLTGSLLESPFESRADLLNGLVVAGELEFELTGDVFAREIANHYSRLDAKQVATSRLAHEKMRAGYAACLKNEFYAAVTAFRVAKDLFNEAGNIWQSKIAQYMLGYALINLRNTAAGLSELEQVAEFAGERKYIWLEATALYWIGGGYVKKRQHTRAERAFERALIVGHKIQDSYILQRNSVELSNLLSYSGRITASLDHLHRAISLSAGSGSSMRQRYRTLIDAFVTLSRAQLPHSALPQALESVSVSDRIGDPTWMSQSRSFTGTAYAQLRDFENARLYAADALAQAQSIGYERTRDEVVAFCNLKLGEIERLSGNNAEAEARYLDALAYYDSAEMPLNREHAHKGLLLSLLATGKTENLEEQIRKNIELTEEYRSHIGAEDVRVSFFETRTNMYDIAVDFEFGRGNLRRAFEYSEMSSARSLIEKLEKGTESGANAAAARAVSAQKAVSLERIQARMPSEVQIIQYSVLEDKVLAWVVTRDRFHGTEIRVDTSELEVKITAFREAIIAREPANGGRLEKLGRDLYDLLIEPVKIHIDRKAEVCIIPSGSIFRLPFAALISPSGDPLLTELRILYAPSSRVFLNASETAKKKESIIRERVLSVGNPAFESSKFGNLPGLNSADQEAREVFRLYEGGHIITGKDALKSVFLNEMSRAEVIHFAGHYVVVPGFPSSSYLLMAGDGLSESMLTNRELSRRRLPNAKLMVIAACESGLERVYDGEGMIGISRTILEADVPLVVGSQWKVETTATTALMGLFHSFRKLHALPSVDALRMAQLELLNDPTGRFGAPYYWASFSVYGGHANF